MGFLDDIKNKAGELGEKAGDAFEVAKDKAGDLVDAAKDKLDTDDDGDVDTADATSAFNDLKGHVTGGGDAPADQVAAAAGAAGAGGCRRGRHRVHHPLGGDRDRDTGRPGAGRTSSRRRQSSPRT